MFFRPLLEADMNPAMISTTLKPSELALLQRVFDDLCSHRGLPGGSLAANDLAAEMIQLYQHGVRDEKSLHRHFDHGYLG